jgi:hypothetical protein
LVVAVEVVSVGVCGCVACVGWSSLGGLGGRCWWGRYSIIELISNRSGSCIGGVGVDVAVGGAGGCVVDCVVDCASTIVWCCGVVGCDIGCVVDCGRTMLWRCVMAVRAKRKQRSLRIPFFVVWRNRR